MTEGFVYLVNPLSASALPLMGKNAWHYQGAMRLNGLLTRHNWADIGQLTH